MAQPQEDEARAWRHAQAQACVPALHGCLAIFISGMITLCFNPVLTQPNSALLYWAATGLGLGLALRMRNRPLFSGLHTRRVPGPTPVGHVGPVPYGAPRARPSGRPAHDATRTVSGPADPLGAPWQAQRPRGRPEGG